jgi:putative hemolysin
MNIWWHLFSIEVTPIEKLVKKIVAKNETSVDMMKSGSRAGRQLTRLIVLSAAEGVISRQEEVMLLRIVELDHLSTRDVMTPRHKISAIEANKTVTDVFRLMAKTGHSRLPVYKSEIDEIIGIVDLKNLMEYLKSGHTYKRRIKDLCRPAFYVPEQINLRNLLSQMQSRKEPLALVFDEYGGIKGLVTLEDIIEEVVGDIRDIEDGSEDRIREIEKGIYIVSGQALLRDLMREIHFPENEEFAALQGYLMHLFGRMPREGEIAEDRHFMYEIKSIRGQKIEKVQMTSLKRSSQKKQDEL